MNQEITMKNNKVMTNIELDDIQKAHLELFGDSIEKAVYSDTPQNRKLGRVGQEYHRGKGGNKEVNKPKNLKGSTQSKTTSKNFEDYEKKYGTDTSTLEGRMNFWAQSIVSSLKMSRNINQIKFDNLSAELKSYMANPKNDDKDFTLAICDHILNSFTDEQKNKKNLKRKYQTIQKIKNYIENEDYKVYREYRRNKNLS